MNFSEQLNEYIKKLDCTAKELAEASELSASVVSRYRKGERLPAPRSEQLQRLCRGIASIAEKNSCVEITRRTVYDTFDEILNNTGIDTDALTDKLNALVALLDINVTDLAHSMNFDASFLSLIRSKKRTPADTLKFVRETTQFTVRQYKRAAERAAVARLIGDNSSCVSDDAFQCALENWLSSGTIQRSNDHIGEFLKKLNEFDLNEYIRSINFDKLTVPAAPFQRGMAKEYFGIEQMKQSEIDFLRATVLSKSTEPVLMYSDMPLEEMAEDKVFSKKWMYGMALMLKKGLHLNMIHNVDRPVDEMMLGLESYIPMYMTGQISPFYFKGVQNNVFCHFHKVSGSAALTGECIAGAQAQGRYYLTTKKEEVAYYREKSAAMLKKAQPLMNIYRKESENNYSAFLWADARTEGRRRSILSSLPLYTLPHGVLGELLRKNSVSDEHRMRIIGYAAETLEMASDILSGSLMADEVPELTKEEFEKYPMALPLSGIFFEKDILYTYEDYLRHLLCTKAFADKHPNYSVTTTASHAFRNIQINIHEGKWVMISKSKSPAIHFVIRHPKLIAALCDFVPPIAEDQSLEEYCRDTE